MGLFDIFRSRIKDLGDSLDEDALTADEDTTEAKDALSKKEDIIEQNLEETPPIQNPELIETTEDDEWEDWDDEISNSPTTEKSLPERRIARDTSETVRPKGSRVNLHVLRSTTGRNLVSVADAPRASIGSSKVDLDSGASLEIDLEVE